jgi:hypothetical protein
MHFSMQGENFLKHTNDKCHFLHFIMQEDDIVEDTSTKCHLSRLNYHYVA